MNNKNGNATIRSSTRTDVHSSNRSIQQKVKEYKVRMGDVILVKITDRTTIELPASLSPEEIDARIDSYKKRHSTIV